MEGFSDNAQQLGLIFARTFGLMSIAPVFATESVGMRMRATLGFLLGVILYPAAVNFLPPLPDSAGAFAIAAGSQLIMGLIIGFMVLAIFSSFQILGEIFSLQMGISFSEVLDPQSQISVPLLGVLKNAIGMLLFLYAPFAMDGLYAPAVLHMLRALGYSFQAAPDLNLNANTLGGILNFMDQSFGVMFLTAVKIGIPLIGILFITSLLLGLLGRAAPQMNLIAMGVQINVGVGLVTLALLMPALLPMMSDSFHSMYDHMAEMFHAWPRQAAQ
ncbi:MAG: flagellar biosynthetic protein FliR [Leptospirales bacterium]|nr:flagellar biosynthetic protein FliR [Leptospirales bacterium]